jgi:hypothetical protein
MENTAIGSARFLDVRPITREVQPGEKHQAGVSYWSSYWHYVYVVEAVRGCLVTVRTPQDGRIWSHSTPLCSNDRVFV